jgi:hypothetical protein
MSVSYNWVCHVCGETNSAVQTLCQHCGFKQIASRLEIDRARRRRPASDVEQSIPIRETSAWKTLTTKEKLRVTSAVLALIAGAAFGEAEPLWLNLTGVLLLSGAYFLIPRKAR